MESKSVDTPVMLSSGDSPETIEVYLSEHGTPVAYKQKLSELIRTGMGEPEARSVLKNSIELELIYHPDKGLFAIESEVVASALPWYSPYSGQAYRPTQSTPSAAISRMQRYQGLRSELLEELRFLLSCMSVNFIDQESEDYEADQLYDLPCISWVNKNSCVTYYYITDLRLTSTGEMEAEGVDDETGSTHVFDEGHLDIYCLAYWLDRIYAGKFIKVEN